MKKLFVLIPLAAALTGCNNDIKAEPYTVPPELEAVLPPDPGDAGKATLEGIDSDGDGVRDDIQRYIAVTYQNQPVEAMIITHSAKLKTDFLKAANNGDEELAVKLMKDYLLPFECLYYRHGYDSVRHQKQLSAQINNTLERTRAYIRGDGMLGGNTFTLDTTEERCKKEYLTSED